MRQAVHIDIDLADLPTKVGRDTYARGTLHLQRHGVVKALWNATARSLVGTVRGSRSGVYATTARFSAGPVMRFEHGECSCPMAINCKHVVALALSMSGASDPRPAAGTPRAPWERSLKALLSEPPLTSTRSESPVPLALELTLTPLKAPTRAGARDPGYRLMGRVVRPSGNGWAAGEVSWSGLRTLNTVGNYLPDHVRLLQDIYTAHGARDTRPSYSYYSTLTREKTIELSGFESPQLWRLLDDAREVGLALVHSRASLGPVRRDGDAQLCLDATSGGSHLALTPVVVVDNPPVDVVPLVFIGSQAHGVVYADRAETARTRNPKDWRLRIARLVKPAGAPMQRLTLDGSALRIPAGDLSRFRDEYYPTLRRLAAVISTDESFTPPAISGPTLVLRAGYRAGHVLDLSWEWAYGVGDSQVRTSLQPADDSGLRDFDAERAVVRSLDVGLERFGLRGADPSGLVESTLHGIETMRFTQEALPLLHGHPGVVVEIDGEPADYREAGDSLRVGVSAEETSGEIDWFDLGVSITVEGRAVPFLDVFMALSRDDSQLLLPDGAYFSLGKPELQALHRLIAEARALQEKPDGPLRISRYQVGLWDELAALGVVDRQARAWQRQIESVRALDSPSARPHPEGLLARLRPYQVDGFSWLSFLWEYQLGGILADDMGLGKTLQSLALICHAKQADPAAAPFLIVAPTSVVSNWVHEAARFAPGLRVAAVSDTVRRRGEALDETVTRADVVVTSYTLLRLDADEYLRLEWSGLLLDEAQFVKNHKSKAYQCVRRLPAPFKLAITGTPMENNLMELWSLLSITAPGLFPNPNRFRDYYARPIEKERDDELLGQLRRRMRPLVKRRTKEQVAADLPAKQEQVLEVELHPRHRTVYQRHLQRERQKVLGLIDDIDRNRFTILRSLTLLRQLSLHAGLVDAKHRDIPSAKIDALVEQLDDVLDAGHRALVFSQFTGLLDLVRARLDAAAVDYCYLDGKTRQRPAVIERFKNGSAPLFLISLKAGGFGLNLTEADYCFLLDPWWNPATETQAIDRTHRIGQTRNVMVYRLIAADTIEQKVMALNARKAQLFSSVMNDGNAFGAGLDADDIRALFT